MSVYAGEYIQETETGKSLRVEHDFEKTTDAPMSHSFDFLARYEEGIETKGFLLTDEGVIWNRT